MNKIIQRVQNALCEFFGSIPALAKWTQYFVLLIFVLLQSKSQFAILWGACTFHITAPVHQMYSDSDVFWFWRKYTSWSLVLLLQKRKRSSSPSEGKKMRAYSSEEVEYTGGWMVSTKQISWWILKNTRDAQDRPTSRILWLPNQLI